MLFTSGDWRVDVSEFNKDRFTTHGIYEFMCEKFNQLIDATVEVNQVDLTDEHGYGFCQVDEDGEFLIHIHNDLSYIPFLLEGVALNPDLNLDDGMHPNEKGVKIISNSILEEIKKLN